jgi:hypothetical protein
MKFMKAMKGIRQESINMKLMKAMEGIHQRAINMKPMKAMKACDNERTERDAKRGSRVKSPLRRDPSMPSMLSM